MDATDFVAKWRKASLQNEMQVYADSIDDLCRLANHPTRLEFDLVGAVRHPEVRDEAWREHRCGRRMVPRALCD